MTIPYFVAAGRSGHGTTDGDLVAIDFGLESIFTLVEKGDFDSGTVFTIPDKGFDGPATVGRGRSAPQNEDHGREDGRLSTTVFSVQEIQPVNQDFVSDTMISKCLG